MPSVAPGAAASGCDGRDEDGMPNGEVVEPGVGVVPGVGSTVRDPNKAL